MTAIEGRSGNISWRWRRGGDEGVEIGSSEINVAVHDDHGEKEFQTDSESCFALFVAYRPGHLPEDLGQGRASIPQGMQAATMDVSP